MIGHVEVFVSSPLSGFRLRPRIGRITLFIVTVVVTAATVLSFPAPTASDACTTCAFSARATAA